MSETASAVAVAAESTDQAAEELRKAGSDGSAAASAAAEESEREPAKPSGEGEGAEEAKKPQGNLQRRMNELTRRAAVAEAKAEYFEKLALGKGDGKPPADSAEQPKAKPKPEDFETTGEYLDARDAWVKEDARREVREEIQKARQEDERQAEQEVAAEEWESRETAAQEKHADYDEVAADAMNAIAQSKGPGTHALAHALQFSEAGPEVLYHLGQHPEEVKKIAGMSPTAAVIAVGRLEARLAPEKPAGEEEPNPPAQQRAPKPPTPIRKPSPVASAAPDDPASDKAMSDEEWINKRNEQVRKQQGR